MRCPTIGFADALVGMADEIPTIARACSLAHSSSVWRSTEEEGTSGCGVGSGVVAGEPSAMPSAASVQ